MAKKSLLSLIFGSSENKGRRIIRFGGETKGGKKWWTEIGEDVRDSTKKLGK